MRLKSIGTRFLEVCERSECFVDQCFGSVGSGSFRPITKSAHVNFGP